LIKGNKFACLTYHAIGELGDQYTLSEKQCRDQLALLQRESYVIDGFEGLEIRLRSGESLPSRYVVLTVDDGHESAMRVSDLLERCGGHASFFLTRDRSASKAGYIREKDIRELRRRGFSLGTHGTTHSGLTFLPEKQCLTELVESKCWLEDVIGEEVRYIAAPGGFINARVMKSAYECGYALVGTCNEWMNSPGKMVLPCNVNRVNVRRHFSLKTFQHILEGHPAFYTWRQIRTLSLQVPKQLLRLLARNFAPHCLSFPPQGSRG
jgi:peptidoglycan/xylan/chitin deacetylase (PgdA/CDA1 family)